MALNLKYASALKDAMLAGITSQISTSGLMRWYSGTQPTNPDTALSGNTLACELALSASSGSASSGVYTFGTITADSSADATVTVTFGSFLTSGGTRKIDFTIGTGTHDLVVNSTAVQSGAQCSCSAFTITSGN